MHGIVNGIEEGVWCPQSSPLLPPTHRFSKHDTSGKQCAKEALFTDMQWPWEGWDHDQDPSTTAAESKNASPRIQSKKPRMPPLVVFVGRLDAQKGVDVLLNALPAVLARGVKGVKGGAESKNHGAGMQDARVAMLGCGDERLEQRVVAAGASHPARVRGWVGFDVALAHRLIAAADVVVVPSRFEPCGLIQMQAMQVRTLLPFPSPTNTRTRTRTRTRTHTHTHAHTSHAPCFPALSFSFSFSLQCGAVPVVANVGGLADTVEDFNPLGGEDGLGSGTGFTFAPCTPEALADALALALATWEASVGPGGEAPAPHSPWGRLMARGMTQDHSWRRAAGTYELVCRWAMTA